MLRFEVSGSQWAADEQVFGGGVHEIARPTKKLLRLVAAAEAAGAIRVLAASKEHRAALKGHVESQAESEKAYAKAQADGRWQEGNLLQYEVDPNGYGGQT